MSDNYTLLCFPRSVFPYFFQTATFEILRFFVFRVSFSCTCSNRNIWCLIIILEKCLSMSSPFHGSVAKDFFQICLPWRIRVKRHSTWPNVKLHTRFLTLRVVNCNVKLTSYNAWKIQRYLFSVWMT
jgi:hypothetical protein